MIHDEHLKTSLQPSVLFKKCYKTQPFSATNSTWYMILPGQQADTEVNKKQNNKYICPSFTNPEQKCCFISIEGQFLDSYINTQINKNSLVVMTEQEIQFLIISICQAFTYLKQCQCANKINNFKQYSIVKLKNKGGYKLLYHQSMISQLDLAKSDDLNWDKLYLSPQQLNGQFIQQKSIVFSFGVMLLNLCAFQDRNRTIYQTDQFRVDEQIIKDKLNLIRNQYGYSKILCNFIQLCLKTRHQNRPNFSELKQSFTRKLQRKYEKQSQFLSQFVKLQNASGISYNLVIPQTFKFTPQHIKQTQIKNPIQTEQLKQNQLIDKSQQKKYMQQVQPNINSSQKKQSKLKRKGSSKFQKLKTSKSQSIKQSRTKQLQQKQIQQEQQIKPQFYQHFNIQYRGTFGERYITPINNSKQKSNNVKNIKKSKNQSLQNLSQQKNKQQTNQVPQNLNKFNKQIQIKKDLQQKIQNQKKPQTKINQSNKKLKLQIPQIKQNKVQQIETPKGFGKLSFQQRFHNQRFNIESLLNAQGLPELIDQMKHLRLSDCLEPIQKIAKKLQRIGVWVEGDLYYGDFSHGRRDGLGLQIFSNGEYYYGYFKEDLFSDQGFYYWNERQYFFGKFELGQKVWGRLQGQVKYQGGFKQNKRDGFGSCWYASGQIYSGQWFNGKKHGNGCLFEPDGSKFQGIWFKGKKRGIGSLSTQTMTITGNWNQQIIQGQAQIKYTNGDIFRGQTGSILQKINGQYISKSGRIFKGDFQNDLPKKGQLKYSNGDRYVGQLMNMKRHGYGQYFYSSGEVYRGQWQNNMKKQAK